MNSSQFGFFATREDLGKVMSIVERKYPVKYVAMGLFDSPHAPYFESFADIPNVGYTESPGAPTSDHHYMLVPIGLDIHAREVPQRKGDRKFAVNMLGNDESVELSPGGIYTGAPDVLVLGRAATFVPNSFSTSVFNYLFQNVKLQFRKVGWIYIGDDANEKLEHGWRLVRDSRLPESEDLLIPDERHPL
jgi:hypothetical protein